MASSYTEWALVSLFNIISSSRIISKMTVFVFEYSQKYSSFKYFYIYIYFIKRTVKLQLTRVILPRGGFLDKQVTNTGITEVLIHT